MILNNIFSFSLNNVNLTLFIILSVRVATTIIDICFTGGKFISNIVKGIHTGAAALYIVKNY